LAINIFLNIFCSAQIDANRLVQIYTDKISLCIAIIYLNP